MPGNEKFYERLHGDCSVYGKSVYDVPRLMTGDAFKRWLDRQGQTPIRLLDIGCGKGQFLFDISTALTRQHNRNLKRVAVIDLIRSEGDLLNQISPTPEFIQQSVDGVKLPFEDGSFDFVSCNHVLEHIFETEKLLREIRRVIQPGGLAVVSVPNIAAWMNRIAFLFCVQPLGTEVGTEAVTYGYWPPFLQKKLKPFKPSGHIRDFTPRSLHDITFDCGFKPCGWWAQNGGLIPTWHRNLGILLEPR